MRDKLRKEMDIGDRVVFANSNYADLYEGRVEGFTPKMVRIRRPGGATVLKTSDQVAIVEKFNA